VRRCADGRLGAKTEGRAAIARLARDLRIGTEIRDFQPDFAAIASLDAFVDGCLNANSSKQEFIADRGRAALT
jgi:hypothetical protein